MKQMRRMLEMPKRYSYKSRLRFKDIEVYICKKQPDGTTSRFFTAYHIPSGYLLGISDKKEVLIGRIIKGYKEVRSLNEYNV